MTGQTYEDGDTVTYTYVYNGGSLTQMTEGSNFATTTIIAAGTWLDGTKMNLLRKRNIVVMSAY